MSPETDPALYRHRMGLVDWGRKNSPGTTNYAGKANYNHPPNQPKTISRLIKFINMKGTFLNF